MIQMQFYKYQGNGNDFVFFDNRDEIFPVVGRQGLIEKMCDRRFGVGADGLILIQHAEQYDFEMLYFNADGHSGSMCGNGGRCAIHFARFLQIISGSTRFLAYDGPHEGSFLENGWVSLKMSDVSKCESRSKDEYFLDTGSPHLVRFVEELEDLDVFQEGRDIRYSPQFAAEGVNVNFVEPVDETTLKVYTYERGVENETLACGTGVTASAIAYMEKGGRSGGRIEIVTKGGPMAVNLSKGENGYEEIFLEGPVSQTFSGIWKQ